MRDHRSILGAGIGLAWLLSCALAGADTPTPAASPSPSPRPRKVYSDEDLKKYRPPSPSPTPSPAGTTSGGGTAAQPRAGGAASGGARPYRRKQVQPPTDAGAQRKNESETEESRRRAAAPEGQAPPERSEEDASSESQPDPRAQLEATWRARAEQTRQNLDRARNDVLVAQEEATSIANRILMSTDTNEILRLRTEQQAIDTRLAQARLALTGAETALTNMEEEARRNNIPPGWLRER
jgi:hypothetical protein